MKQYSGKKEDEPEELTHLTEGSFEDATIIVSFSHNLSIETKKASLLLAHLQCSSLTSPVRSVPEDTSSNSYFRLVLLFVQ